MADKLDGINQTELLLRWYEDEYSRNTTKALKIRNAAKNMLNKAMIYQMG